MRATFGDFTFDARRKTLTRRGALVALTPKAFALLAALVEAAPDALTKDAIYERLWAGVFVEAGNLHNLINELRDALGDEHHEMIRTVHRIGYAFSAPLARGASAAPRLVIGDQFIELDEGETIVGRERLGTPDTSRRHARILVSGADISVEDLGSKNGTFVRGERIRGRVTVRDGDEIVFGRTYARLQVLDTAASTVTAS